MEESLPQVFLRRLSLISREIRRRGEGAANEEGLSAVQMYILFCIEEGQIENIGGICRHFNIGHPNASIMCKRLEGQGIISRERSSDDERFVKLALTEKGKATVNKMKAAISGSLGTFIRGNPEEMKTIFEGLSAMERLLSIGSQND